jgi:hypothetical protein
MMMAVLGSKTIGISYLTNRIINTSSRGVYQVETKCAMQIMKTLIKDVGSRSKLRLGKDV